MDSESLLTDCTTNTMNFNRHVVEPLSQNTTTFAKQIEGGQIAESTSCNTRRKSLRKQPLTKIKTEEILFLFETTEDEEESKKRRRVLSSSSDSTDSEHFFENAAGTQTKSQGFKTEKLTSVGKVYNTKKIKREPNASSKKKQTAKKRSAKSKPAKKRKTQIKTKPLFDSDDEDSGDNNLSFTASSASSLKDECIFDSDNENHDNNSGLVASRANAKDEPADGSDGEKEVLTAFEAQRKKNIEERMRLFQELKINEAREELEQNLKKSKPKSHRPSKVTLARPTEHLPRRKSLRLEGLEAVKYDDISDQAIARSAKLTLPYVASMTSYARDWGDKPRDITTVLSMTDVMLPKFTTEDCEQVLSNCCAKIKELDTKEIETSFLKQLSLKDFKSTFEALKLKEHHKVKVTPTRIYSMSCHPNYDGVLLAAGCKSGAVGIWNANLDSDDSDDPQIITFNHHVKPTSCVSFSKTESQILYSTSYDGTVRRGDLQQQTFTLVYTSPEDDRSQHVAWHCEISPSVLLVGQADGNLVKVDMREPDSKPASYKCYDRSVRTIDLHPITKHHIVTTSSTRLVSIWDLRKMKKTNSSSAELCKISFKKTLSGAFFSPVTGDKLLTTSYDDNISVYSCKDLSVPTLESKIDHNNNTGRWVTNFKATWHPQREDIFIVGDMARPRKLPIYQALKKPYHVLCNVKDYDHFTTIGAVALFHPTLPVVVCGNASGYIHLFI